MSQPFSRYLHPFDVARQPSFEPEVKRSILASWTPDHPAGDKPLLSRPPGSTNAVPVGNFLDAMLDEKTKKRHSLQ